MAFDQLRTEGAFLVSAQMKSGEVQKLEIKSLKGNTLKVKNPFYENFESSVKYELKENILQFETDVNDIITLIEK